MNDWVAGYRAAIADVGRLAHARWVAVPPYLTELLIDLDGDALVIEREQASRMQRRRLTAAREAMLPFDEAPP